MVPRIKESRGILGPPPCGFLWEEKANGGPVSRKTGTLPEPVMPKSDPISVAGIRSHFSFRVARRAKSAPMGFPVFNADPISGMCFLGPPPNSRKTSPPLPVLSASRPSLPRTPPPPSSRVCGIRSAASLALGKARAGSQASPPRPPRSSDTHRR
jgi:hypothetical protein